MRNCCHSSKFCTLTIISQKCNQGKSFCVDNRLCSPPKKRCEYVLKTSWKHVNKNGISWWYVSKASWRWRHLQDFARRLEDVLKTFWRRLENVLKTSWSCLEDVFARRLEDVLKTFWRRLEDVLKTYDQDEYIDLDQDVLKTSSEDVWVRPNICLDHNVLKTFWKRPLKTKTKDVFIKMTACWDSSSSCWLRFQLLLWGTQKWFSVIIS